MKKSVKGTFKKNDKAGKVVYIRNLSYRRDEKGIKFLFSRYGKVKSINIIEDLTTKKSKGYAFVEMFDTSEALSAIKGLDGAIIDGRTLKATEANEYEVPESNFSKAPKKVLKEEGEEKIPRKRRRKGTGLNVLMDYLNP